MKKTKKIPVWFPYLSEIYIKNRTLVAKYKGGEFSESVDSISNVMIYGATCPLSQDILEMSIQKNIPICFHRRNMCNVVWIGGGVSGNKTDILSKQILFREHKTKRRHIAYKLLDAKFKSMSWLVNYPIDFNAKLSTKQMRIIEARHARNYWKKYYGLLRADGTRRGQRNSLKTTLDAVSKFMSGIVLRWISYHRLSPQHAYLHEPTDYPSLVYDLMEPYRGYVEKVVFNAMKKIQKDDNTEKDYLGYVISEVESYLDEIVYVDATRQLVTFQELIHGSVIALRAYFVNDAHRYIVPVPGKPKGGRPKKTGYRLYGRSAGKTDFWKQAELQGCKHKEFLDYI